MLKMFLGVSFILCLVFLLQKWVWKYTRSKEQTNLKICTALCMIRFSRHAVCKFKHPLSGSRAHTTHTCCSWDFYYTTLLRISISHTNQNSYNFTNLLHQAAPDKRMWTCHCQHYADWMESIFSTLFLRKLFDDVCVQRNAFCAAKALSQNVQIFIAKKSCPSSHRFAIFHCLLRRCRLSLDQSFVGMLL